MRLRKFLSILPLTAISCGFAACQASDAAGNPPPFSASVIPPFRESTGNIAKVEIVSQTDRERFSASVTSGKDIASLLAVLESSQPYYGAMPANLYRTIVLTAKDGTKMTLDFALNGDFFTVSGNGGAYKIDSEGVKKLNLWIDRAEKEYAANGASGGK